LVFSYLVIIVVLWLINWRFGLIVTLFTSFFALLVILKHRRRRREKVREV